MMAARAGFVKADARGPRDQACSIYELNRTLTLYPSTQYAIYPIVNLSLAR